MQPIDSGAGWSTLSTTPQTTFDAAGPLTGQSFSEASSMEAISKASMRRGWVSMSDCCCALGPLRPPETLDRVGAEELCFRLELVGERMGSAHETENNVRYDLGPLEVSGCAVVTCQNRVGFKILGHLAELVMDPSLTQSSQGASQCRAAHRPQRWTQKNGGVGA